MSQVKRNSGQPKQKWTEEEEQALKRGVKRYGIGKWRLIQKDDVCGPILANRSNVDLKDKWRNLNMEARDKSQVRSVEDDPDFQKENQRRRRRSNRRSSLHSCGISSEAATSSGRLDDLDVEQYDEATDAAGEEMAWTASSPNTMQEQLCPEGHSPHSHMQSANMAERHMSEAQGSANVSPHSGPSSPMIDDMVVAAVISLQDPSGSGPEDICTWIEAHYHAVSRESVEVIMAHLIRVGRLQQLPEQPSLVCMAGLLKQLADQTDTSAAMHVEPLEHPDEVAAELALLAAQAVMEAEEASRKVSSLLEAAHQLYELEHPLAHDR